MARKVNNKINQIVQEAITKVINEHKTRLNEGQSDGNPIEKWNYWCTNYDYEFIEKAWEDDPNMARHLRNKFDAYYDSVGSYGVMVKFYLNLDDTNRKILENYVMNNY